MNSYINIERNANLRKERAGRAAYALTEACALFVCAILNFFSAAASVLRCDAVRLVVRGVCACVAMFVLIGTVGALELGEITFAQAAIRSALTCGASFVVFKLFGDE